MIAVKEFAVGLTRLGVAWNRSMDTPTLDVYFEALRDQTNAPEWEEFTREAVHEALFTKFPNMSELLEALFSWRAGARASNPQLTAGNPTDAERAESRRRGLAAFRAELKRLGVPDPLEAERIVTETEIKL